MYRVLTHVRYEVALLLTFVENLICTPREDYSSSLSARPHLCSRKLKRMYRLLTHMRYDVALLSYHNRSMRWNCLSIDTVRSIVRSKIGWVSISRSIDVLELLEYWYRTIFRLIKIWLSIDTVRSIDALEFLEYWHRTIDRSIENWLSIDTVWSMDRKLPENISWSRSKLLDYWSKLFLFY